MLDLEFANEVFTEGEAVDQAAPGRLKAAERFRKGRRR
jgi:hypothetical protein